ncbi:MAG TPA: hypothetical protein VGP47_08120 [Parachlamydiaceae bacterium]|nr:hypothetical protein [Parachlamydiaceae bacterium]
MLGRMCEKQEKEDYIAFNNYDFAARQGYSPAQFRLGEIYENGLGVIQDMKVALNYYELAAKQGDAKALEAITRIHLSGSL